jgi:hypothetical protein
MSNETLSMTDDGFNTWGKIDDEVYFGDWGYNKTYYCIFLTKGREKKKI